MVRILVGEIGKPSSLSGDLFFVTALFDKLIEGRETQTAESWRVLAKRQRNVGTDQETLAILCFLSHHQDVPMSGNRLKRI